MNKQILGSQTAKNGFANEKEVAEKFNNWEADEDAQKWLLIMGYDLKRIEEIKAVVLKNITPKPKSDVNIRIKIKLKDVLNIENISVKLVSNTQGFNQVDKRKIDKYVEMWNIPNDTAELLKLFTGETVPKIKNLRDKRRMFLDEFSEQDRNKILKFFEDNKMLIINDILRGRGEFSVEWVLVAQKINKNTKWILKNINEVINHYSGEVKMSPKGSILIGSVTVQRKGGTPDPASLQFKINPLEIFDI